MNSSVQGSSGGDRSQVGQERRGHGIREPTGHGEQVMLTRWSGLTFLQGQHWKSCWLEREVMNSVWDKLNLLGPRTAGQIDPPGEQLGTWSEVQRRAPTWG